MLSFLRSCRVLSNLQRCNHLNRTKPYSVAEHGYFCAILAIVLCDLENQIWRDNHPTDPELKDNVVKRDKVVLRMLLHDTPEILTGDILYPVKHFNERVRVNIEKMELELVDKRLFEDLDGRDNGKGQNP
jgi:5'-deoxynucleotidase YfbR-like HD superfamily hydrolase